MGCAQSKIDNEESVARCKQRRQYMKEAVTARNAFAAAHSAYIMSLKNTGAALSEYGQVEMAGILHPNTSSSASLAPESATAAPIDNLPPPPPPLPNFPPPLQRAASMPDLPYPKPPPRQRKNYRPDESDTVIREDEEEEEDGGGNRGVGSGGVGSNSKEKSQTSTPPPPPPPPPPPDSRGTWDYFFDMGNNIPVRTVEEEIHPEVGRVEEVQFRRDSSTSGGDGAASAAAAAAPAVEESPPVTLEKDVMDTPPAPSQSKHVKKSKVVAGPHPHHTSTGVSETKRGKVAGEGPPPLNLVQILIDLDDHFLKASQSAQDVSRMLEATRLHYHSNFADNRGHINHSEKVMRVITWNKSFKGLPNDDSVQDDFDNDEWETHASILDKLLAWEKKLYDEVKVGELMKIEYQKKVALLTKQKKRGANADSVEKTKAAVSHLHTRYIVDIQSMDSTVSEIQRLRDEQLHPKLVSLVEGMAQMWETMCAHHDNQLKMVWDLRGLDISSTPVETNQQHLNRTAQLYDIVSQCHSEFQKLVKHQKEYIQALNNWLKLNIIPIESSLKEKVSSPPRLHQPPIQALLHAWHDRLEKLPDDIARSAIHSFADVIKSIMDHQHEELTQKRKCEDIRKEYDRKNRAFTDWCQKNANHNTQQEEADGEQNDNAYKNAFEERRFAVESLRKSLEKDDESHRLLCKQVRDRSVANLRTHLPELFRAMSDFSLECYRMYKKLKSISQMQNNGRP